MLDACLEPCGWPLKRPIKEKKAAPMMEFDFTKLPSGSALAIYILSLVLGILGLDKYKSFKSGTQKAVAEDQASIQGENAIAAQFKLLQNSINDHSTQLTAMRAEQSLMSHTIHSQQKIITRMEMVIIQLRALLNAIGHPMPQNVQEEIDALIESEKAKV